MSDRKREGDVMSAIGSSTHARRKRIRGVTCDWHRVVLLVGTVMVAGVVALNVRGNPLLELRDHRVAAMTFSHVAVSLVVLGLAPRLRTWLARLLEMPTPHRARWFAAALVVPMVAMGALSAAVPEYAHQILTREWGLVEPVQFAGYLTATWLAFSVARLHPKGRAERRFWRLAAWGSVVLALEEIDYFGVVSITARSLGVPEGRVGGVYVGTLHDLLNLATRHSGALPLVLFGTAVMAAFSWLVARGLGRVLVRETLSVTSLPLLGTLVFMTLAQLTDIDKRPLAPLVDLIHGHNLEVGNLREEPMELLAVICLNMSVIMKLRVHRSESSR